MEIVNTLNYCAMHTNPPESSQSLHVQASHWHALLRSAVCTDRQKRAFEHWLADSEAHRQAYLDIDRFWRELGELRTAAAPELQAARDYLGQARPKPRFARWAIAASMVLMAAAYPFCRFWFDNGNYLTIKGEQNHVELSDGSAIDLNTDSEIRVAYSWFERKVILERGEAMFSVEHDADRPFQVAAANGVIRDIGTRFNVYRQADGVAVTVLEGEVSVATKNQPIHVQPGQAVRYDAQGRLSEIAPIDADAATAWQRRQLVFKRQPLSAVLAELGRYHDANLQIADPGLKALKVSGSFPSDDLPLALKTMAEALPIRVDSPKAGTFVVVKAK